MNVLKSELIGTTYYAGKFLSNLFGISEKIVVFPLRRKGSVYDAEFFYKDKGIYLDIEKLAVMNHIHIIHTLGEEAGHYFHYRINPEVFHRSDPTKNEVLKSFKNQTYNDLADKVLRASNLLEFVGFFSGLHFLSERFNLETALEYARTSIDIYSDYIADNLREIEKKLNQYNEALQESYYKSQNSAKNIEAQIMKSSPEIEKEMSHLKHGFGYRLASKVYFLNNSLKRKIFRLSLKSNNFSEFCRKIEEKKIVSKDFFIE